MNIVKEIADLLKDQGIGTFGTDIFIGTFPDDVASGILLIEVPSGEQEKYYDIYTQEIEVWTRNIDTEAGFNKLQEVFDYLHRLANTETTNAHIYFVYAVDNIQGLGRDTEKRALHKTIFRVIYRNLIS